MATDPKLAGCLGGLHGSLKAHLLVCRVEDGELAALVDCRDSGALPRERRADKDEGHQLTTVGKTVVIGIGVHRIRRNFRIGIAEATGELVVIADSVAVAIGISSQLKLVSTHQGTGRSVLFKGREIPAFQVRIGA